MEALVLHVYAEWADSQDSSIEVSLLLGILSKLFIFGVLLPLL